MNEPMRLLTEEEIRKAKADAERISWEHRYHPPYEKEKVLLEAQDAKTTSIKDAEWRQILRDSMAMKNVVCQAKVERIFNEIERISLLGDAGGKVVILSKDWVALKKQEGVTK